MSDKVGIIQYGVGALGTMVVRSAVNRGSIEFRGAIDTHPEKVGKDLGQVAGLERDLGVVIAKDSLTMLRKSDAPVVLHTTGSILPQVLSQLENSLRAGKRVISTCEELVFPAYRHADLAQRLDRLAKQHGATLVSTGINPGFVMDLLPLTLSSAVEHIEHVYVKRYQDASHRRRPFQEKIGVGMTAERFQEKVSQGSVRHAGLGESIALIADRIGWRLHRITEEIEPVISSKRVTTPYLSVARGEVAGCRQLGRGWHHRDEVITLEMCMYVGAREEFDSTVIEGSRRIEMLIPGGIHGDSATVARVLNTIPVALEMEPGCHTVADLPVVCALSGS